jgi:hypothetical protein
VTVWHLSADKKRGGSDARCIVTDDATPLRRQRTNRRCAVSQGSPLAASGPSVGLPGPTFAPLLSSGLPWLITAASYPEGRP